MGQTKLLTFVLCLLGVAPQLHAFSWPHWGRCPNLPVQQDFSLTSYQGFWFEQAGYNTESVEGDKRCVYALYYLDNGVFRVRNHGIDNRTNKWGGVNGTAQFTDPTKNEGKLTVSFNFGWWKVSGPYWVLGTDYNTYSVVYTCENFLLFFHYYTVWFLSRDQTFSTTSDQQTFYNNAFIVLTSHRIPSSLIHKSVQTNCTV